MNLFIIIAIIIKKYQILMMEKSGIRKLINYYLIMEI